ncbi:MAG: 50S ribosomal protein L24 [Myxococcota bacterium]
MAMRIRVGDLVQVTAGADKGKQGKVIGIDAKRGKVRVEKVRLQKHHMKPGRKLSRTGGVVEHEGYVDASNVMLVDPETQRPARIRVQTDENGKRIRVFARSGTPVPAPSGAQ